MNAPMIHPGWHLPQENIVHGFSLEMTAKDIESLDKAAGLIPKDIPIAVTFLAGESVEMRIAACKHIRLLGCEPMPHFSARRIASQQEFLEYLDAAVGDAGVRRCFVIAGDSAQPEGPYADSLALIRTGAFEQAGIKVIGIAGHPEGHPNMSPAQCLAVLSEKCEEITARGMAPLIVTQFAFDAPHTLAWLSELRREGIEAPVRLGVPGPAGIKTLVRFAARCGVGASTSVLTKYGISIGSLLGSAGPDKFLGALEQGLGPEHGLVRLHFYPFGGLEKTAQWIADYARTH